MKMAIEPSIRKQGHAGAICREGWQTVPVNVETAIVKRIDCLMKHVTLVNIVTVRQTGSNWQNSEQYRQGKNRTPANPVEDTLLCKRLARQHHHNNLGELKVGHPCLDIQR